MYKALIFDLDGTTGDTIGAVLEAMNMMLDELHCPHLTLERFLDFFSGSARDYAVHALPESIAHNEQTITLATALFDKYYGETYPHTENYPGINQAIDQLKNSYTLCMLSNKQDDFVHALNDKLFAPGTFTAAHGVRAHIPAKPAPDGAIAIARELGVLPEECIFIGDSEIDLMTARNAHMAHIGVTWGYRSKAFLQEQGAVHFADSPAMLVRMLNDKDFLKSL